MVGRPIIDWGGHIDDCQGNAPMPSHMRTILKAHNCTRSDCLAPTCSPNKFHPAVYKKKRVCIFYQLAEGIATGGGRVFEKGCIIERVYRDTKRGIQFVRDVVQVRMLAEKLQF